jgi:hypothetical protein
MQPPDILETTLGTHLTIILAALLVAGCVTIHPRDPFEKTIRDLIGTDSESAISVLGEPNARYTAEISSYFLYERKVYGTETGYVLPVPISLSADKKSTYAFCYLLEFDESNILRTYWRKSFYWKFLDENPDLCREQFSATLKSSVEINQ